MAPDLSDQQLFDEICARLTAIAPPPDQLHLEAMVDGLQQLPRPLRAMASIHQLDVSLTLDDIVCHFNNWHSRPFALETLAGLTFLGATREADLFSRAFTIVQPYWEKIGDGNTGSWYDGSDLARLIDPINDSLCKLRDVNKEFGLMRYWIDYARRDPCWASISEGAA